MPPVTRRARRFSVPTCSRSGLLAFLGGGFKNIAGGGDSGVLSGSQNDACDDWSAVGAGSGNGIGADSNNSKFAFIGGGFGNAIAKSAYGFVGAGYSNTLSSTFGFIGAGADNTNSGFDSGIVGGSDNTVTGTYASIDSGYENTINFAKEAAISAGTNNLIDSGGFPDGSSMAFIGSGYGNSIKALSDTGGTYGVISGGLQNLLEGAYGAIGGGGNNAVTANGATVAGGYGNSASGSYATVPGGETNSAIGELSFAAGHGSYAGHDGAFVWSDNVYGAVQLKSTGANQFLARASGGVAFYTNATLTTGVTLGAGSGTWGSVSDRTVKTHVETIDDKVILDKVAALPISKWSYTSEHGVRHVGPMAQDFYAAFGVGEDNRHITSIDEDGVALAAIKALHGQVNQLRVQLARKDTAASAMARQLQTTQLTGEKTLHQLQKVSAEVASLRSR